MTKSYISLDRRKADHLDLPIKIYYSIAPRYSELSGPMLVEDIGGGGLKFKSAKRIKKSQELSFEIELPDNGISICVKGKVVWCKKIISSDKSFEAKEKQQIYNIGVQFYKMDYRDRSKYVLYLCEQLLRKYLNAEGRIKIG